VWSPPKQPVCPPPPTLPNPSRSCIHKQMYTHTHAKAHTNTYTQTYHLSTRSFIHIRMHFIILILSAGPLPSIILRWGWVFLERTRILSGIQFTTHFIEFLVVETKQFVGSSVNVILTRKPCGQRSSRAAESKHRALENYFPERICHMFQVSKCTGNWDLSRCIFWVLAKRNPLRNAKFWCFLRAKHVFLRKLPLRSVSLFASTKKLHRRRSQFPLHFHIRNILQIRSEKSFFSARRLLSAALLERRPQICRVKVTFTELPTNRFVSTTKIRWNAL